MTTRLDLLALCIDRAGVRNGRKIAQFVMEWELAVRVAKRPISIDEYAAHWHDGRATAYRRLGLFRDAFPGVSTPQDLMGPLLTALANGSALPDGLVLST